MNNHDSIDIPRRPPSPEEVPVEKYNEKDVYGTGDAVTVLATGAEDTADIQTKAELQLAEDELLELERKLSTVSLERCVKIIKQVQLMHRYDQNFPGHALERIATFLGDPDVLQNPNKYPDLVREMKMEAILSTENSPYQEVRANVDPTDDPSIPSLTFRVWVIGIVFSGIGSFVDTLFLVRQPAISIGPNVAQMVAYPCGRLLERILPTRRFTIFGQTFTLNPGKFSPKEHMLITIMASVSFAYPYTAFLIPTQALPQYFGQAWAKDFGYQLLATMGINFCGYGLAGLARRFIVYPSSALWPSSLATVALNKAFHTERNEPVKGPFGWVYKRSREQVFLLACGAMFIYYFFPGYIFQAMSLFSWMSWIAPNNGPLNNVTGFVNGVGLNPWPTFDWNNLTPWLVPLTVPTFSIISQFIGIIVGTFMTIAFYYSNSWNTSYLPINDNHTFDNTGSTYNVSRILNDESLFDAVKYQEYSEPWMSAGFITYLIWYFAMYAATLTYVLMFHRHDMAMGVRSATKGFRKAFKRNAVVEDDEDDLSEDIHVRLMKAYPEVPEWWFAILLVIAMAIGMASVGAWPTNTSPVVVIYGIVMPLIAILPCGYVQAVTGIAIPLQVLAQFIGGAFSGGNGVALMFFKSYGYISMYQALAFCNDLKLAHYIKIPPRHTFICQIVATLVNTFVAASIFNFQMSFPNVCTKDAAFRFICPGQTTFFTGAVFWGTLGPKHLFGAGKRYNLLLFGFPVGVMIPIVIYLLRRSFPRKEWLRQIHPVMICAGPANWGSPYNFSYYWPNVMVAWFSFQFIRKRYMAFWAKYNYVIAAAFPAGIALAALVIFFCLQIPNGGLSIEWWGNDVVYQGCEGDACIRFDIPEKGYFGPDPNTNSFSETPVRRC